MWETCFKTNIVPHEPSPMKYDPNPNPCKKTKKSMISQVTSYHNNDI